MSGQFTIRRARGKDAAAISALVIRTLWASNLADYGAGNIARVASNFGPEDVAGIDRNSYMLVAVQDGRIVGTASLGATVLDPSRQALRTFFVDPEVQGTGIGTALLTALEAEARRMGLPVLRVRSSVAGQPFYAARGFAVVSEHWEGDERTIQVAKPL